MLCGESDDSIRKSICKIENENYPYCVMMEINGMSCTDCQQQIENEFNQKKIYLEQHLAVLLPKQDASVESV